ncbi:MAG: DUF3536 domain-containing protein [Thermodesulfobacteriota bacterium]
MSGKICIHGHFYQPPRQDPWLEEVLPEGSAAPFLNWNERIARECYSPLAFARLLDRDGCIRELVNCYEWISFNFGPTLLSWMERHLPMTYARILEGDRASLERCGHGNAIAQVYHHTILPLDSPLERKMEIRWSIYDFESRFGRRPEGMWLAETAVDTATLEDLADEGIGFTILSPRQAEAVLPSGCECWQEVDEQTLDTSRSYRIDLPSGKDIAVLFYNGTLATAIAFEQLLGDGESLWLKLLAENRGRTTMVATDGESYGHHFKFGEMALAYVIDQARQSRDGLQFINAGALLAASPPEYQVRVKEKSSWSCIHGLDRWKEHCGCADGRHPGWNQHWRRPLRRALNYLKYYVDEHFFSCGIVFFHDCKDALLEYGRPLSGLGRRDFAAHHFKDFAAQKIPVAWSLLEMQRHCLAAFASCAWFFDDIYRLEPMNGLTSALRAMQLLEETSGPNLREGFLKILEEAESNRECAGDGRKIWKKDIEPRLLDAKTLVLAALCAENLGFEFSYPGVEIILERDEKLSRLSAEILWQRTGKREAIRAEFSAGELDQYRLAADSWTLRVVDMPPRLRSLIQYWAAAACTRRWWEQAQKKVRSLAAVDPVTTIGQNDVFFSEQMLAAPLVWNWIQDGIPDAHILRICREKLINNPILLDIVQDELQDDLLQRLKDKHDEALLRQIISRSKEAGIDLDMFEVQNLVWLNRNRHKKKLLREIGMAESAGEA